MFSVFFALALIIAVVMVLFMLAQIAMVIGFYVRMASYQQPQPTGEPAPKAGVVLCLRGCDPFLEDCLNALFSLDYPDYEVLILIDDENDPAREVAEQILAAHSFDRVRIEFLQEKSPHCSLKCSSLVQAANTLAKSCDIFVQLDADTIVHKTWLTELATALSDPKVAVATGNRWYAPENRSPGALVRYVWNSGAIVQMYWYAIPWGGTLAIKTSLFRQTDVLQKWATAFCEDTMLFEVCRLKGFKVAFVPPLLMINREDCGLFDFSRWVSRQLVTARLYHPAWIAVCTHGLGSTVVPMLGVVLLIVAAALGDWRTTWLLLGLEAGYQVINAILVTLIELAARAAIRSRPGSDYQTSLATLIGGWLMLPMTQFVYGAATLSALFTRTLSWRGVDYAVRGPFDIAMKEYRPYRPVESEVEKASL